MVDIETLRSGDIISYNGNQIKLLKVYGKPQIASRFEEDSNGKGFRVYVRYCRIDARPEFPYGLQIISYVGGNKIEFDKWRKGLGVEASEIELVSTDERIEPLAKMKGITKPQLMAYVIAVHGPLEKGEILRQVAMIEGKPFFSGSNVSYFGNGPQSVVTQGILEVLGKSKRRMIYGLTIKGFEKAAAVIQKIGREPAIIAGNSK